MDDNEKEKIAAEVKKIKDGLVKAGINEKYIFDEDDKVGQTYLRVPVKQEDGSVGYEDLKISIHPIKEKDEPNLGGDRFQKKQTGE
jgi:hypothetical protein